MFFMNLQPDFPFTLFFFYSRRRLRLPLVRNASCFLYLLMEFYFRDSELFFSVQSDQFLQIIVSVFCFSLVLSEESFSLFRILTLERIVTNLTI